MSPDNHRILKQIFVWLIACVPAITLHECAHGWMALSLGDPTARNARRLSLNPIRHIDPVGTIVIPGLMLLVHTPFVFGWAKPVPVDFRRLRHGRLGILLVALAGPMANFVMMFGWLALVAGLAGIGKRALETPAAGLAVQIALSGAAINMVLMLFNLIPIPPLDGGRILGAILPDILSRPYMRLERVGILILLLLIVTGVFGLVFNPLLEFFFSRMGMM